MYTHFRGTTFQFVGQLQDDGVVQDLTNCILTMAIFDPSGENLYGNLIVSVIDAPIGLVTASYPDTSGWPVGKARLDMTLTTAVGEVLASPPEPFRIAQSPLIG